MTFLQRKYFTMKNIHFLIIVFCLTVSSSFCQGLNFATGEFNGSGYYYSSNIFDTTLVNQAYDPYSPPDSAFNHYQINLIPFEGQEVDSSFRMELVTNTIPPQWHYQVCNNITCWPSSTWWDDYQIVVDENDPWFWLIGYETWDIKVYPNSYPATAEVKVYIYKNGEIMISDSVNFTLDYSDVGTAINESSLEQEIDINMYPNPASENVFIEFQKMSEINKLSIIDMSGKIVESIFPEANKSLEINLTNYQKGIYLIKIFSNNITIIRKLVVK